MDKKLRFMDFHIFEGNLMEQYLSNMAGKGWFLQRITAANYTLLSFAKGSPATQYYYVDYFHASAQFAKGYQQQADYIAFMEGYGYEFVAGKGTMLVFCSKERKEEIHQQNEDEQLQQQRAIHKFELSYHLFIPIYILLWAMFIPTPINQLPAYAALAPLLLSLSFCYPYGYWLLSKRGARSIFGIKVRSFLQCATLLSFSFVLLFPMAPLLASLVAILITVVLCFLFFV